LKIKIKIIPAEINKNLDRKQLIKGGAGVEKQKGKEIAGGKDKKLCMQNRNTHKQKQD
jgi:hypothetical protein